MTDSFWKKLTPFPRGEYSLRNLNSHYEILYDKECQLLIAVPDRIPTWTGIGRGRIYEAIYKYSFCYGSWRKYEFQSTKAFTKRRATFPKVIYGEKILATTNKGEIATVNLIDATGMYRIEPVQRVKQVKEIEYGQGIMVQDEIHFFNRKIHIKYNLHTQTYSFIAPPTGIRILYKTNLIRIKQKLIAFTSSYVKGLGYHHYIYEYNITKKSSKCFPIRLSKKCYCVSCTSILNQQIILLSVTNRYNDEKIIYIYDVKTKIVKKSNIKVPCNQCIFAVNDKRKDILVTYGWIKNHCKYLYIPVCLKEFIGCYYINESLHVLNSYGQHYKTEAHRILDICYICV